jgi:hypothetical protein
MSRAHDQQLREMQQVLLRCCCRRRRSLCTADGVSARGRAAAAVSACSARFVLVLFWFLIKALRRYEQCKKEAGSSIWEGNVRLQVIIARALHLHLASPQN